MTHHLLFGIVLGLSAGYAPGPLITLVVVETLRHGIKAGLSVAIAPLITDLPIILISLFVLSSLSQFHFILGLISLVGGGLLVLMGFDGIRMKGIEIDDTIARPRSLLKGILVNVLSPHPILFWISVGGPLVNKAMDQSITLAIVFVSSFYVCIVGAKMSIALVVDRSKGFLTVKVYIYLNRILGLALWVLAVLLIKEGLELLKIL